MECYHSVYSYSLIRSYNMRENQDQNCKIWEAIRATTASSQLFDPIIIGPLYAAQEFVGAELVASNPISILHEEKEALYRSVGNKPPPDIGCVLSLGCGTERPISLKTEDDKEAQTNWQQFRSIFGLNVKEERSHLLYNIMMKIATNCEKEHERTSRSYQNIGERVYFRLNVIQGLEDIGTTAWSEDERQFITVQSRRQVHIV
jgi:hypothetical protein